MTGQSYAIDALKPDGPRAGPRADTDLRCYGAAEVLRQPIDGTPYLLAIFAGGEAYSVVAARELSDRSGFRWLRAARASNLLDALTIAASFTRMTLSPGFQDRLFGVLDPASGTIVGTHLSIADARVQASTSGLAAWEIVHGTDDGDGGILDPRRVQISGIEIPAIGATSRRDRAPAWGARA